jgi:hypothetical protein
MRLPLRDESSLSETALWATMRQSASHRPAVVRTGTVVDASVAVIREA